MPTLTPAEMVEQYIKLRDYKKAAEDEFEKSLERCKAGMKVLESMMLAHLNETGATSVAAKGIGTVYKNTQYSATVNDREAFMKFVQESGEWAALDVRANKTYVREQAEKAAMVPGVTLSSVVTVGVRRSN